MVQNRVVEWQTAEAWMRTILFVASPRCISQISVKNIKLRILQSCFVWANMLVERTALGEPLLASYSVDNTLVRREI